MRRSVSYLLAVVGLFGLFGAGVGLASNFTLSFFIEQFVEPGTSPLDNTQVALMFLVSIFFTYAVGPVAAGVAGVWVGGVMSDREALAGIVAGLGGFVGFYLFVALALFLTLAVLSEFGPPGSGGGESGGGGGGGGGGGSPLSPSGLLTLMMQVSLLTGLVGFGAAYLTGRIQS
jgi:hypothetical protein